MKNIFNLLLILLVLTLISGSILGQKKSNSKGVKAKKAQSEWVDTNGDGIFDKKETNSKKKSEGKSGSKMNDGSGSGYGDGSGARPQDGTGYGRKNKKGTGTNNSSTNSPKRTGKRFQN